MSGSLILIGASVRAAAHSALRAGFQPYAIDQFADRDLAACCPAVRIARYPRDFLQALRSAPQAPWLYTGGLENHPQLIDRLSDIRPLWGNSGEVLKRVRHPEALAATAHAAGMEMPAMRREISALAPVPSGERWLRKPFRSSGGHRISELSAGVHNRTRAHYYQRYVEGVASSAIFCEIRGNCQLLGVSRQLLAACGDFRYGGSIVDFSRSMQATVPLLRLGEALVDRFSLRGLFNVDFVRNTEGWWPLEVNPRYSASVEVLERATGRNFLALHAAAFDPMRPLPPGRPMSQPPNQVFAKAIIYAHTAARVPPAFDNLTAAWNKSSPWPAIADLPRVGALIRRGEPLCSLFAEGKDPAAVVQSLSDRECQLQKLLGDSRHP